MTDKTMIMQLAVLYRKIYQNEGAKALASKHKLNYESNTFPDDVLDKAILLTNVYLALDDGLFDRNEAIQRQKKILNMTDEEVSAIPSVMVLTTKGEIPLEDVIERRKAA